MFCDNCGAQVADDAVFCPKCGQQMQPSKAAGDVPPPRTVSPRYRRRTSDDFLCFGEERKDNPYVGGIIFILIGLFLAVIFFDLDQIIPFFQIEYLLVLAFFVVGALFVIQAFRKGQQGG